MVVKIMAFIDWLKRQQERSEANRRLFEGRPMVAASEAWSGYQDSPGGQRLMVRQREMPKVDNTLTIKDDGTRTHVKKWTDPDERTARFQSDARATALPPDPMMGAGVPIAPPRNQRTPFDIPQHMFPQGALSPEAQAAISQVQATGGQNVDAHGQPITRASLANLGVPIRAMGDIISRMQRRYQGVRDDSERNRIRRLMQHRTTNPYYPTGNPYGLNLTNRNPYPRGIY